MIYVFKQNINTFILFIIYLIDLVNKLEIAL